MAKTAQEFINEFNGKKDDYDGVYGAQCVDGYKRFCRWLGVPVMNTKTGWADGYWYNRLDMSAYVKFITNVNDLKEGDWCFWAKGSSCPSSHVAMFVKYAEKGYAYFFGENQGGNGGFRTAKLKLDILGAFRFNALEQPKPEWRKDSTGWWYRHADGSYTKNGWEKINGKWYHFNAEGYMQTGWIQDKGKWYFLDESGAMKTGWVKLNGKWYYLGANGAMYENSWVNYKNNWYYLGEGGVMLVGNHSVPAHFNTDGALDGNQR